MQIDVGKASFIQRWGEDPGWRGFIGFITPPNLSVSHLEFIKIAPPGFVTTEMHTYMTKDGMPTKFDFTVEGIDEAVSQMEHAARVLKVLGVDLIAQSGTPYSFCHPGGFAFSRELRAKIEKDTGLPVVLMGLAVSNAVKRMGCKTVAVSSTYYYEPWREKYTKFLEDGGLKVLGNENFISLGYYPDHDAVRRHTTRWFSLSLLYEAAKKVADMYPEADCVIQSGAGVYSMDIIEDLEIDLGKPVITSAAAQSFEILYKMRYFKAIPDRGSLLASLGKGR